MSPITKPKPRLERNKTRLELDPELVSLDGWERDRLMYELGLADEPIGTPTGTPATINASPLSSTYATPTPTPSELGDGETPINRPPRRRSSQKTVLKLAACLLEDDDHGPIAVTETPEGIIVAKQRDAATGSTLVS
eukprot:Opistho-1_new@105347